MFFRKTEEKEDLLYSRLRDYPEHYSKQREQIAWLWSIYERYAPHRFLDEVQQSGCFHQRWWEMYCCVGLSNILVSPDFITNKNDDGPDFMINLSDGKRLIVEAVAPQLGNGDDKLNRMTLDDDDVQVSSLPEEKFLLRLTNAIKSKNDQFIRNSKKEVVLKDDYLIIAISTCGLGYNSLMDFPVIAPLKILKSKGDLYINLSNGERGIASREPIIKNSGMSVDVNMFDHEEMNIISAILYSNTDPLNSPNEPENTFHLIKNPNAINSIDHLIFKEGKIIIY